MVKIKFSKSREDAARYGEDSYMVEFSWDFAILADSPDEFVAKALSAWAHDEITVTTTGFLWSGHLSRGYADLTRLWVAGRTDLDGLILTCSPMRAN